MSHYSEKKSEFDILSQKFMFSALFTCIYHGAIWDSVSVFAQSCMCCVWVFASDMEAFDNTYNFEEKEVSMRC